MSNIKNRTKKKKRSFALALPFCFNVNVTSRYLLSLVVANPDKQGDDCDLGLI